ncbi:MAG TPA: hypothetical protein VGD71_21855, partial [Kribbella sp.]
MARLEGVDVQEVDGKDAFCLLAEKLRPPWTCSPWRRTDPSRVQDPPHRRRGDVMAEPNQLTLDT